MSNKNFLFVLVFIILLTFSGCPDKDKSSKDEKNYEKLSNSMKKAASELEQVVTLLGGPMFYGRDVIEQLKSEQIEALTKESTDQKKPEAGMEQSTSQKKGDEAEQNKEVIPSDKREKEQGEESKNNENGKTEEGKGNNEAERSNANGRKEEKNTQENTSVESETKRPAEDQENANIFQFEESLFGIPLWQSDNWKMIQVLSDGMYFSWNGIQPELLEKGVSSVQIENYNTAMAKLSKAIKEKNIKDAQVAAFQLTQANADFFSFYKTSIPSELQRLKSTVIGVHFYVKQNDWGNAHNLATQLQQILSTLKSNVEDNKSYAFQMLEISISDLEKSIQEQDSTLVLIRTNLVTANLYDLETELSQLKSK
ncbi:MAG: hypothetical protein PHC69_02770 [Ruminiclostridium sp.]|nr:hypothetical protein [Ruminiclostridium sp.]